MPSVLPVQAPPSSQGPDTWVWAVVRPDRRAGWGLVTQGPASGNTDPFPVTRSAGKGKGPTPAWKIAPGGTASCRGLEGVPCVPVLVPDLLFHLGVCQGLQQRTPLVSIACVPDGNLHRGQGVLTVGRRDEDLLVHRAAAGAALRNHCLPSPRPQQKEQWGQGMAGRPRAVLLPPAWGPFPCPDPQSSTEREGRGRSCHLNLKAEPPGPLLATTAAPMTPGFSSSRLSIGPLLPPQHLWVCETAEEKEATM